VRAASASPAACRRTAVFARTRELEQKHASTLCTCRASRCRPTMRRWSPQPDCGDIGRAIVPAGIWMLRQDWSWR